jgi:uncharacterized protein (DUF1697 family)
MRYVAFLRAVNVGGRVVKMDRLRTLFESLKLRNVETFIASGNVMFDSTADAARIETRIENALEKMLGYAVPTFLRQPAEVAAAAKGNRFGSVGEIPREHLLYVGFMREAASAEAQAKVMAFADDIHQFAFAGREMYWYARHRPSVLRITGATMERALRAPVTFRSISTVRKIAAKME